MGGSDVADFTEDSYRDIIADARSRYLFEPFGTEAAEPHVLWRHDVDISIHRALKLARIEADQGVRTTFLLSLRGPFYSLLEPASLAIAREIAGLGHWLGLHFHTDAYDGLSSERELDEHLRFERRLLSELTGSPIDVLSFHNPGATGADVFDADTLGGMINAYGASLRGRYAYVSDSNGYWRHERIPDVIASGEHERLHVLTHPEWWQETPMSPSERLERCLTGRADYAREWYEGPVRAAGRDRPT
jgi:hypothetical protein